MSRSHQLQFPPPLVTSRIRFLVAFLLLSCLSGISTVASYASSGALGGYFELAFSDSGSQISYPEASPSDPDIIAYTRRDGNRRYLHLYHVVTGVDQRVVHQNRREQVVGSRLRSITRPQTEQLMLEAGLDEGYFEGDLNWRPGLDQFGYQWFAFVATQAGRTQLHLGYIASGETLRTVVFPISFGTIVTNPVFSPDGNSLILSVDGQLYIQKDIGRIIRKRDFQLMQPRRLTSHARGSFFPAWSGDGRLIAYQSRPVEGRRSAFSTIYVINMETLPEGRLPTAHRVSIDDEEGEIRHHKRPSWAPSGQILSWYEDSGQLENLQQNGSIRSGPEDTEPSVVTPLLKNIRIVRVEFDRSRSTWVGMPLQRQARRFFADPVIAFPRSAPRWAVIEYDRRPAQGILWVRFDPDLGNPLHFSHLSYYSDNRADFRINLFSFSNRFEWLERTVGNRHPVTAVFNGNVRFIWIAESENQEVIKVADRKSSEIQPLIRREISEHPAVIRGGLIPGWGHRYIGERRSGTLFTASFVALAGATGTSAVLRSVTEGKNPNDAILISLGAATAAVWTFNILDLSRRFPAYREVPVPGTFEGYRSDVMHDATSGYGRIDGPGRRDALLLSALYPGLGQIYIGERNKGYALGLTFTALAGSTLASAAYRYHYPGPTPSNEVLIGLGVATFGTWIYSLIDLQQSFSNTFFAGGAIDNSTRTSGPENPPRTQIALSPRIESMQFGNYSYREYAAVGLSFSF